MIQDQILEIKKTEGQTVILITNDVDEGLYMADRLCRSVLDLRQHLVQKFITLTLTLEIVELLIPH